MTYFISALLFLQQYKIKGKLLTIYKCVSNELDCKDNISHGTLYV
jgi:hypothetical protein